MATYAVGDLQGCLAPLHRLLDEVNFSSQDQLWLAGDLVNRGPESLASLRFVKSLGQQATVVLGNHDLHLLALHHQLTDIKVDPSLGPILAAQDRQELMGWLQQQPLLHYSSEFDTVMTHAGIPPCWDLTLATQLAEEVHQVLISDQADTYFRHMYGNLPDLWQDNLQGPERWRCITNYFTRMRFTTATGQLEFKAKAKPTEAPVGFAPWFQHPSQVASRQVFGHWAALEGETHHSHIINLDMGCVWGGSLKMMCLDEGSVYTTSCH